MTDYILVCRYRGHPPDSGHTWDLLDMTEESAIGHAREFFDERSELTLDLTAVELLEYEPIWSSAVDGS